MRRLRHLRPSRSGQHDLPRASTRCSIAARRAPASRRRTASRCASRARWATSPTSSTARRWRSCRAARRSATCATRRPARAGCSMRSRSSSTARTARLRICHNGNLVNARELRDDLVRQGSIFQSNSDTEVILHLYARSKAPTRRGRDRRIGLAGAGRVLARDADARIG